MEVDVCVSGCVTMKKPKLKLWRLDKRNPEVLQENGWGGCDRLANERDDSKTRGEMLGLLPCFVKFCENPSFRKWLTILESRVTSLIEETQLFRNKWYQNYVTKIGSQFF